MAAEVRPIAAVRTPGHLSTLGHPSGSAASTRSAGRSADPVWIDGARMAPEPPPVARMVLEHPDPHLLVDAALRATLGGDIRPAMLVYLAATSRLLDLRLGAMACPALVQGPPAAGKSATLTAVRQLLPPEAVVLIDAASPHVLIYGDFDLRHKALFVTTTSAAASSPRSPITTRCATWLTSCTRRAAMTWAGRSARPCVPSRSCQGS